MRPMAPENFDGDATTDRLDPTGKAQVDLLDRLASLVATCNYCNTISNLNVTTLYATVHITQWRAVYV